MIQIKRFLTVSGTNKWLKQNKDKKIISVNGHYGGFTVVFEVPDYE